jgi:hypothetical protein
LDVSSPRLFPVLWALDHPAATVDLLNPDAPDLAITCDLVSACGLQDRCTLSSELIGDAAFAEHAFDVITCLSVLEHIPQDATAAHQMWNLLKPGGTLIITMPCAAKAYDLYINQRVYDLLPTAGDGFNFLQTVHDHHTLQQRLFDAIGQPTCCEVWGERTPGFLRQHLFGPNGTSWRGTNHWAEPALIGREFRRFDGSNPHSISSISALPGEGVVCLEFRKP